MIAKEVRVGHIVNGRAIKKVEEITGIGPSMYRINDKYLFFCWEDVVWEEKNKV